MSKNCVQHRQMAKPLFCRPNATRDALRAFRDAMARHQAGRIDEAVVHYRRFLCFMPAHAEAHNNLGVALATQGKIADAMSHYQRALALCPDFVNAHSNLGLAFATTGRIDEAIRHYERALVLDPRHACTNFNLGCALAAQGKTDQAVACYGSALILNPGYADAHYGLGQALAVRGRIDEAVSHFESVLVLNPNHAGAHFNLGVAFAARGDAAGAAAHYERTVALDPTQFEAHNNLGVILNVQGRRDDAVAHLKSALILRPENPVALNNLGIAVAAQGRIGEAAAYYEHALAVRPDYAHAHSNLALARATEGRIDEAIAHYTQALATDPNHAEAHNNLACIFKDQGKLGDALAHYERAIAIRPDYGEAHLNRSEIKTFHEGDCDLAALEAMAARSDLPANKRLHFNFAAAKALEDSGNYVQAFEHMRAGNTLKRGEINYDETSTLRFFERIRAVFDRRLIERFQRDCDPSSVPVFVLGMPRSGSTLIEQILASHPQVYGAGEMRDLDTAIHRVSGASDRPIAYPECVPPLDAARLQQIAGFYLAGLHALGDGQTRIVDKTPANFLLIGLIRMILPNARIIHTMRNPIDTCVSCYSKLFTSGIEFSYDLAELGRYYRGYRELMTHWRSLLPPGAMLDVSYEEVVGDLEGQARRLIDYCGLPWDDRCISFHKTSRTVKTASAVQVRKPLFHSSLQRWRRYEAGLGPLLLELKECTV